MLNILKKVSPASYLFAGGAVISLIAMIIAAVSCSGEGFGMKQLPLVIVLSIAAIVLGVAIVFVSGKFGDGVLGYAPAERACNLGIASIVVYLVASVITAAGGFFKLAKADK